MPELRDLDNVPVKGKALSLVRPLDLANMFQNSGAPGVDGKDGINWGDSTDFRGTVAFNLVFPDGTVSAPGIRHQSAADSGFYYKTGESVTPYSGGFADADVQAYSSSLENVYRMDDTSAPIVDALGNNNLVEVLSGTNTFAVSGTNNEALEGPSSATTTAVHYSSGAQYIVSGSESLTLSFWLYLTDTTEPIELGFKNEAGALPGWNYLVLNIDVDTATSISAQVTVRNMDSPARSGTDTVTVNPATLPGWYHFTYRQSATDPGELIIDGDVAGAASLSGDPSERAEGEFFGKLGDDQYFALGANLINNLTSPLARWGGNHKIDEIYIWKDRLSDAAVTALAGGAYWGPSGSDTGHSENVTILGERKLRVGETYLQSYDPIHVPRGTATAPGLALSGLPATGLWGDTDDIRLTVSGTDVLTGTATSLTVPGKYLAGDGTSGAPAYSFTSDTDTGMTLLSAGSIGWSTSGTERMRLSTAQLALRGDSDANTLKVDFANDRVGVGTTSPSTKFHVLDSSAGATIDLLRMQNDVAAQVGNGVQMTWQARSSAGLEQLGAISYDIRDIGAGTEGARAQFSVLRDGSARTFIEARGDGDWIRYYNMAGQIAYRVNLTEVNFNEGAADIDVRIEGTGTSWLLLTDAGNDRVGILTGTPTKALDVRGDVRMDLTTDALGGGASATLGTIGGTGPTVAGQNQWARIDIGGTTYWLPVWV